MLRVQSFKPAAVLFSCFGRDCGCAELAISVTTQNNSWYAEILTEKSIIFDGKRATTSTSLSTHTEARVRIKETVIKPLPSNLLS